ncbi:hypothetical protein COBT_000942 [Conglomerata obtusa]
MTFPNLHNYTKNLPPNYNFELNKTLTQIISKKYQKIALQFPDGLLKYALIICDIIKRYTGSDSIILGDVVYGACCLDDETAFALGCDLLLHYGHSCLVPINVCRVKCMYVFVDIFFDNSHCEKMIKKVVEYEKNQSVIDIGDCDAKKSILFKNEECHNKVVTEKINLTNEEIVSVRDFNLKKGLQNEYYENKSIINLDRNNQEMQIEVDACCKHNEYKLVINDTNKTNDDLRSNVPNHQINTNKENIINLENITIEKSSTTMNDKIITNTSTNKNNDRTDSLDFNQLYNDVAILGTIQFNSVINKISKNLNIKTPQLKPLSRGEVLGCTSPILKNTKIVIYIADGRFHLESIMINNPHLIFYKYCPFTKRMSREYYDYTKMLKTRKEAKEKAFKGKTIGVILGTLGRQGSLALHNNIEKYLLKKGFLVYNIALKEINEFNLEEFYFIDSFVQICCPRLSTDWGVNFNKPILNSYEVFNDMESYSMDYYSKEKSQPWTNYQ